MTRIGGAKSHGAGWDDADEVGKADKADKVEEKAPKRIHRAGGCLPSKPVQQTKRAKSLDMSGTNLQDQLEARLAANEKKKAGGAKDVKDLGELSEPGKKLRGKIESLKPGETLRFTTHESPTRGLGAITVTPPGALIVERNLSKKAGPLGSASAVEYTFTMPKDAKPGDHAKVKTEGRHQVRNDKDWSFSFEAKVGK